MQNTPTITLAGKKVTRDDVIRTIDELDQVGKLAFLDAHGYRESTRWHLRHNGRSYPSKAVMGVAAGLKAADFFGGVRGAVQALAGLGFHVRNSETGERANMKLDILRRVCERKGLDVREPAWPNHGVVPTAYFASGSNRAPEIKAMGACTVDVGVAVPELTEASITALEELAGSDVEVFVDSGAFSEVKFGPEGCTVVKPITDADWQRILGLYGRLADALGSSVWVVAPDRVGCQATSLERLGRYAGQVRDLHERGARILVPIQKGDMTQAEFANAVDRVLGFTEWVPAMPCKKAATTPAELDAFIKARKPQHVHLLGLGVRNRSIARYMAPFLSSTATVSLDSCWLAANAVRVGKPRRLTRARDMAGSVLDTVRTAVSVTELAVYCCLAGGGLVNLG